MEIAKVSVSGVNAQTVSAAPIPVGIIGASVTLEFNDPVWDGLTKNVVFVGTKDVEILDVQDSVVIPAEAITAINILVRMGICGIAADGSMAIPTLWADLGVTRPATPVNMGTNPQLPVWAQLQNMIGNLRNLETEDKSNLVAAVNEVKRKSGTSGENANPGGYVKSVNGVKPDAEGNVEITILDSPQSTNGLTTEAAELLIDILETAVFTANNTAKIARLKEALASGSGVVMYSIANNLTNTTSNNSVSSIEKGSAYTATLAANNGYEINAVTVTMGGVDITDFVYSDGVITIPSVTGNVVITVVAVASGSDIVVYTISNNLTNATSSNAAISANKGESYTATLAAAEGYELDSVTVTMGGVDVTATAYADGVVSIAAVTGNVVITATAAKTAVDDITVADGVMTIIAVGSEIVVADGVMTIA